MASSHFVRVNYVLFLLALVEFLIWSIPVVDSTWINRNTQADQFETNVPLQRYFLRELDNTGHADSSYLEKQYELIEDDKQQEGQQEQLQQSFEENQRIQSLIGKTDPNIVMKNHIRRTNPSQVRHDRLA